MDIVSHFIPDTDKQDISSENEVFIGAGSTSVCYRVNYYGKIYCKKQLRPELKDYQRYRDTLRKEYELGVQLNCPYIVRYCDIGEDSGGLYVLTDYVKGPSLTNFVKQHPDYFKSRSARRTFINELLTAVDYLHQRQILHLDLKPDNILITEIGNHVKLVDCGFAYQDCYTQTMGGTEGYSAPEQFNHKYELSTASDIYALGNIFKQLQIAPKKIIERCLKENPAERYSSVTELRNALNSHTKAYVALALCLLLIIGSVVIFSEHHPAKIPSRYSKFLVHQDSSGRFKVETIVFDSTSQPPLVGGYISRCDSSNLAAKGIIVSTDTNDLYLTDTLVGVPVIEFRYNLSGNMAIQNEIRSIVCSTLGAEQFAYPLQHLMGDKDYYIKAFITTQWRKCVYGAVKKIHTHSFKRYTGAQDVANVFYADKYTAFDLMTDEIMDIKKNGCFYSSNEMPTTCIRNTLIGRTDFYKFKTFWNYRLWYTHFGGDSWKPRYSLKIYRPVMHFQDGKLTISNNPQNAHDTLTFYYTINGDWQRPENFCQRYTGPITITRPCQVHCYATTPDGNISFTSSYKVFPEQLK
jgi:tRNA A-37 threonylcarbamoyl transferase component Bud32